MNSRIRDVFRQALAFVTGGRIERRQQNHTNNQVLHNPGSQSQAEHNMVDIATPTLSPGSITQYERAILVESSSTTFGNDCLRSVNIAFQTSQTFSSMMGTCAAISQYLRKELMEQYPNEYFHLIIGENNSFSFAISDDNYFAEIEQKHYRVLIFTTKRSKKVKYVMHDANSQMVLEWKPVLIEQ